MSFLLFIILNYFVAFNYAADCISRYPITFGKLNSGVKPIGVVAN